MDDSVYQLKISLRDSQPVIWRRLEVLGSMTLESLHWTIQAIMSWSNSHLHQFRFEMPKAQDPLPEEFAAFPIGGSFGGRPAVRCFSDPQYGLEEAEDESAFRLDQLVPNAKTKFVYEYDFGDSWDHMILVEKIKEPADGVDYPLVTGGAGHWPLVEDCGGVWGWAELLSIVNNPSHEGYKERRGWLGMKKGDVLDGAHFDSTEANEALAQLRQHLRSGGQKGRRKKRK